MIDRSGYLEGAIVSPERYLRRATQCLRDIDFDTFVVTGVSGMCIGFLLARRMKKYILVIRKSDQESHGGLWVGTFGRRWVFLDDFQATGATLSRVKKAVKEFSTRERIPDEYVGAYFYLFKNSRRGEDEPGFVPPGKEIQPHGA